MKNILLLIFITMAGSAEATMYYVSPSGSNTPPYSNWDTAAQQITTVITAGNSVAGPHTVYVAPGTYAGKVALTNAYWANGTIIGTAAHGSTASASAGQVVIYGTADHSFSSTQSGVTISNLSITTQAGSYNTIITTGSNFVGNDLYLYNAGNRLLSTSAGTFTFNRCRFEGNSGTTGVYVSSTAAGVFNYCIIRNSTTLWLANGGGAGTGYGIGNEGSGEVILNNCIALGARPNTVSNGGTGTITIKNSIIQGSIYSRAIQRSAGTVNTYNSLIMGSCNTNASLANRQFSGTVGTSNNVSSNIAPRFVSQQRTGYVVLTIDDATMDGLSYAQRLEPELRSRGIKGTWYVSADSLASVIDSARVMSDGYWAGTRNLEIGYHGQSHSRLSVINGRALCTVTKTDGTIDIDYDNDTITLSGGTPITGYRSKTLGQIGAAITAWGGSMTAIPDSLGGNNTGLTRLGETISDSNGEKSTTSGYTITNYVPTDPTSGGFLRSEIIDGKATIEGASFLNHQVYSMSTPYGLWNENVATCAIAAGFTNVRNTGLTYNPTNTWLLQNIDTMQIMCTQFNTGLIDSTRSVQNEFVRWYGEWITQYGGILVFLAHDESESPLSSVLAAVDLLRTEYPTIKFCSMYEAINEIKNGGYWSTTDNRVYTRTWTDGANFRLQSTSSARRAGTPAIPAANQLTTDIYGHEVQYKWWRPVHIGIDQSGNVPVAYKKLIVR